MSNIILRDYQADTITETHAAMRAGAKRPLIVVPTGGGKTCVAAYMLDGVRERKQYAHFTVHRRELAYQTSEAFQKYGIPHGIVAAGMQMQPWHNIQIVLIGSYWSRRHLLRPPQLIIPDEAHHARAATWERYFDDNADAWRIGLTATPQRLDGRGLGKHFDRIVQGPTLRWLINQGYLVDYKLFAPPPPQLDGVQSIGGDYNLKQLRAALEKSTIVGDCITEYRTHCNHQRAIVRSIDIEYSKKVCEQFIKAGYRARHVDGMTDAQERREIFDQYRRGVFEILCQVELAGEGVDIPGIVVAIDLRPTKSLTYWLQYVGRALRPIYADGFDLSTQLGRLSAIAASEKPYAVLLDHVGNNERNGFPDDEREWSLEDRAKRKKAAPIFSCKVCFAAFSEPHRICPSCGELMQEASMGGGRIGPDEVDGRLEEITPEERKRRQKDAADQEKFKARHQRIKQERAATTLEDLEMLAAERGYSPNWARHVLESREKAREKYKHGSGRRRFG